MENISQPLDLLIVFRTFLMRDIFSSNLEQHPSILEFAMSSPITRTTSKQSIARTPLQEAPLTRKVVLICAFSPFCGILFGYDSAYISGVLAICQFKIDFGHPGWDNNPQACHGYLYDSWQKSLITSILSAGTLIGALSSGYFADWFGRRISIILGCIVYIVGIVLQTAAQSVGLLVAGRCVAGLGVGIVSATNVMYVSEITPQRIRGRVLGLYQFSITVGLLLAACVAFGTKDYHNSAAYRIVIGLQFAWPLILIFGLSFMPESPRYHVMKENDDKAKKSLATLRDQPINSELVVGEHAEMRRSYTRELETEGSAGNSWLDCFSGGFNKGSNLHRTFIGTTIQMMQQLSKSPDLSVEDSLSLTISQPESTSSSTSALLSSRVLESATPLRSQLSYQPACLVPLIYHSPLMPSSQHRNYTNSVLDHR
jgi:sugar porter (SP) family MFS transporter